MPSRHFETAAIQSLTRILCTLSVGAAVAVLWSSCGAPESREPKTVASTAGIGETTSPHEEAEEVSGASGPLEEPVDLKRRMIEDGRRAAGILLEAACEEKSDVGTLAAVYARRVGLEPDSNCEQNALVRGVESKSPLIRALSRRRLIDRADIPIPTTGDFKEEDPAVSALVALAYAARRLPVPSDLASSISLSSASPTSCAMSNRSAIDERSKELRAAAWPFDDGPVAASVAFVESAYEESCEISEGEPIWSAARLRQALLQMLQIPFERIEGVGGEGAPRRRKTELDECLDNPLVRHPGAVLTEIALSAEPGLRIEALRAEIIQGGAPTAERLAAAAKALQSSDMNLRIEGARSFLLLVRQMSRHHHPP